MIEYEEDWLFPLLIRWKGGVYYRASMFAIPGAILSIIWLHVDLHFPNTRSKLGIAELDSSIIWGASTTILLAMVGFRTKQGYSRFWEGTGLLHQMKGEWFDTISNCVTFSIATRRNNPEEVNKFRHTIVRLMSLCHASALEEISGMDTELDTIDTPGLDYATLRHLKECVEDHGFNKVEVLLHLIQSVITSANEKGLLAVPPPILSRVYQTCSRGYVNLLNTKKITDTKFPFPYAQLICLLLYLHTLLTPMLLSSILSNPIMCPMVTFMVLFGIHALNFIAIELENPFGEDDNDLPLAHFQEEMNSCLLMLLHDNTDLVATLNPRCVMDFSTLKKKLHGEADGCDSMSLRSPRFAVAYRETSDNADHEEVDPEEVRSHGSFASGSGSEVSLGSAAKVAPEAEPEAASADRGVTANAGNGGNKQLSKLADEIVAQVVPPLGLGKLAPLHENQACNDVDDSGKNEVKNKDETTVGLPSSFQQPRDMNDRWPKDDSTAREPKLVQSQQISPPLIEGMGDLYQALNTWTQMMEDQVRNLNQSFTALNRLSHAAPRHWDITLDLSCHASSDTSAVSQLRGSKSGSGEGPQRRVDISRYSSASSDESRRVAI
mmetsp:Transcript_65256/g.169542  ORF Transcript_65256/g.169542 Transcript_65256/m.169542 type:complete len:607 (+) Transcript_65256:98-1918(+)